MATAPIQQTLPFTINIPKVDLKRFKGLAKAMGWTFEEAHDAEYYARLDRSIEQANNGEVISMKDDESVEQFLNRLLCTE